VVDAAHTTEAMKALRIALEETGFPHPRTLVFSLAVAKQVVPILAELRDLAEEIIWTRADPIRSMPPEELRALHGSGTVIDDPAQALDEALRRGNPVVTTGSFYLAGKLRPRVRQRAAGTEGR
jgi:folylpolyglutamate synthase/dihydropteroate synthase